MKKKGIIISIIITLLISIGLLFYFLHSKENILSKNDNNKQKTSQNATKIQKNNEKNEKKEDAKEENKTNDKVTNPSVSNVNEKTETNEVKTNQTSSNNGANTQNVQQNQNVSQPAQQSIPQQSEPVHEEPKVDPNATDTSHPLYSTHRGVIDSTSKSGCDSRGVQILDSHRDLNLAYSCIEVYSVGGYIKGYFLEIRENGIRANQYK